MTKLVATGVALLLSGMTFMVGSPMLLAMLLAAVSDSGGGDEPEYCATAVGSAGPNGDTRPATTEETNAPGERYETLNEEQLRNAKLVVDTGVDIGIHEFGLVVAIATAMQESRLLNLDHGDRDSLGLFQQRPSSGWGTPEQIRDPKFATLAFYGGSTSPHWRAPSGKAEPPGLRDIEGWTSMTVAEAAQSVQRSAFPDAYAQWEPMARVTVAALAGDEGGDLCGDGEAMTCPATDDPAEEGLSPDALRVLRCLHDRFGTKIVGYIGVADRPTNPDSDHPKGLAVDAIIAGNWQWSNEREIGDEVAAWLVENAQALGVKYVIWYERIWASERIEDGWRPYEHPSGATDDTSMHRDHVHVSTFGDSAGTGGAWVVPVQGDYTITARFGDGGRLWANRHTGVDLAAPSGRPVVAASAGTVSLVEDLGADSYGLYVVITHPDGTQTWYAHLEQAAPGLTVKTDVDAGQLIGYLGCTGNCTGPHLHFEVRPRGGSPVDPEPWMRDHGAPL